MEFTDPRTFPWDEVADLRKFDTPEWTARLLDDMDVRAPGGAPAIVECIQRVKTHCIKRLQELEKQLNNRFIEKDHLIRMVIVCAIAHQPMLLVGKPGTAKSKIIVRFCEGLGLGRQRQGGTHHTLFQYLLNAFTEPDEILGPVNIRALRDKVPKFRRLREGTITEAEVIFMDEVFRANSAILNALLSVINERQVLEGDEVTRARARLIYGAANTTPNARQLDDLRAFYSRFVIRMESTFVSLAFDPGSGPTPARQELLRRGWANEVDELRAGYRPEGSVMPQFACLNDILLLNRAVAELWDGADLSRHGAFLGLYHNLVSVLAGGEAPVCEIDDRKFVRLLAVLRAHSLYVHNGPPEKSDLVVLCHIWDDLDNKVRLAEEVGRFIGAPSAGRSAAAESMG